MQTLLSINQTGEIIRNASTKTSSQENIPIVQYNELKKNVKYNAGV